MKITVCKGCRQAMDAVDSVTQKPVCPTCFGLSPDSGVPIEVELPDVLHCCYGCGNVITYRDGAWYYQTGKRMTFKEPPFVDARFNTFYCGCRGWD